MSKIDVYSKFISKQSKIAEHSSIPRKNLIEKDVSTQEIVAALTPKNKEKDKEKNTPTDSSKSTSMDDYYATHKDDSKSDAKDRLKSLDAKVNQPQSGRSTESLSGENNPTPPSVSASQPTSGQNYTQSGPGSTFMDKTANMPAKVGDVTKTDTSTTTTFDTSAKSSTEARPDSSAVKSTEDNASKQSSMKSKAPKATIDSREKRMSKAVHSGSLQDVVSSTYGEETNSLRKQIIEKYTCGCGDKMKKKKDK